jgi:hypothetical protein
MLPLINKIKSKHPTLNFVEGKQFCWSPETSEIIYASDIKGRRATWSLLHETGHALLNHTSYEADVELLRLEVDAWEKARTLAISLKIKIDDNHIQDCLDTYRDWLYKRSICPTCRTKCLQQDDHKHYRCFNCHTVWKVSSSRFCRAYRSTKLITPQPAPVFFDTI